MITRNELIRRHQKNSKIKLAYFAGRKVQIKKLTKMQKTKLVADCIEGGRLVLLIEQFNDESYRDRRYLELVEEADVK